MDIATQARLDALLLEREELLLRIHALETRAGELLGEPWPFEAPELPSTKPRRKAGKPRVAKDKARTGAATLPPSVRPDGAWLVVYEQHGRRLEELHRDAAALETLLACQGSGLKVIEVR